MQMPIFENIMVLLNNSQASMDAMQYAVAMGKTFHCNVNAVCVVDTATLTQLTRSSFFVQDESQNFKDALESDANKHLKYAEKLGLAKGVHVRTHLLYGTVWAETVALADRERIQVILLGAGNDRAEVDRRDAISTTYRQIAANANCSVMFVRCEDVERIYKKC